MNTNQIKRIRDFISALPDGSWDSGTAVLKCVDTGMAGGDDGGNCQNFKTCSGVNAGNCINSNSCRCENNGECRNNLDCSGYLKPLNPYCLLKNPACGSDVYDTCKGQ